MIANTPMDTDKIKIYGSRVRVDSMMKVAEIEESSPNLIPEKNFTQEIKKKKESNKKK